MCVFHLIWIIQNIADKLWELTQISIIQTKGSSEDVQEIKQISSLIEEAKEIDTDRSSELRDKHIKQSKLPTYKIDLANRQDVVNKASLRYLKKYYLNIFKIRNAKIVRARFCNAKSSEVMHAIKRTFRQEFLNINLPQDFSYYLMGALKLKDISRMSCSEETKSDANAFIDWWRNYSKFKFNRLFKNKSLQVLWKNFIAKNPSNENCVSLIQNMKDL